MGATPQAADGEPQLPAQFVEILTAAVPKLDPLEVVPDAFIRVEVRCVGRQLNEVEPRGCSRCQKVADGVPTVNRRSVPDDEQLARNLAQQLVEEGDHVCPADGVILDVGEEPALRRDRADNGEVIVGERRTQHRRLSTGGIGARHERQGVEAGLVYEENCALLRLRFA